ncbi:MAG: DEAD/DEAH box helicase [Candidatus Eisenbacteria bacterium]
MVSLPTDIATALTPEQRDALFDTLVTFPRYLKVRGSEYARGGSVSDLTFDSDVISADVKGSRLYQTRWRWAETAWAPLCSCPSAPWCKHAFALGLLVAGASRRDGLQKRDALDESLPVEWRPGGPSAASGTASQRDPLTRLREGPPYERHHAALDLLREMGLDAFVLPGAGLHDLVAEPDPDLRCHHLARAIAAADHGRVHPLLAPYFDRADLVLQLEERQRREVLHSLDRWSRSSGEQPRRLRLLLGLIAHPDGSVSVTLQPRLTSGRLLDAPRTGQQLETLAAELRRDPGLLSPPQARLLRMLIGGEFRFAFTSSTEPHELNGPQLDVLLDRAIDSPFVVWGEALAAELASRCGLKSGDRLEVHEESLALRPECVRVEGELQLRLSLVWPDGRSRPFSEVVRVPGERTELGYRTSVVLAAGAFHRVHEEPPPEVVRVLSERDGLPLRREDREVLEHLAERFSSVREAIRPFTRIHHALPVVCLDLRDSDWLQFRVFAHAGAGDWDPTKGLASGEVLFEWTPLGGWERIPDVAVLAESGALDAPEVPEASAEDSVADGDDGLGPALMDASSLAEVAPLPAFPVTDDPWLEQPDLERLRGLSEWLGPLPLLSAGKRAPGGSAPPEHDVMIGAWLRVSARTAEVLLRSWNSRPPGVRWFGNRAARRLLDGARVVRPSVKVASSGIDWFEVSADWEAEGLTLTQQDLARLRSSREPLVKLASGWVRREIAQAADAAAETLADMGVEMGAGTQRVTVWQLAQASEASLAALERMGVGEDAVAQLRQLRSRVTQFEGLPQLPPPAGLQATLRPYQQEGFEYLTWTTSTGLGAVLADDMGLGKTVQALAWIEHLRATTPNAAPTLVVCPASVVHNWVREAARFTPGLRVLALEGASRHELRRGIGEYDLLITNYTLLRRDAEYWRELPLRAAILDEAQHIKNPAAAVTKAALSLQTQHRLALTGTPLENRALDLWSILSFVNPGYLGSRTAFVARYDGPEAPPYTRRLLAAKLRPVMLRRLKSQVAQDLPPRIEERIDCELTPGQRKLYLSELTRARGLVRSLHEGPGGLQEKRFEVLASLTRLRQICCHPALAGGKRALGSGKFTELFELLEELLAEGHKVLVFSQFVECLKLLREELVERSIPLHWLTGETTGRGDVVDAFERDERPCVFLLSLKAGGTGLNLTAASHVVLFDPWWNPAVEAQAIDRTHRIGQKSTVIAFRMLTAGTVEERIFELQQRKADLARDILGEETFARRLTADDLEQLLRDEPVESPA